jgi:MFS family permease
MPTEAMTERTQRKRAARIGIGITVTFLVAIAFNWTLAYLAPVFAAPLLQGRSAPTLRAVASLFVATFIISAACLLAGGFARVFPIPFMLSLIPALYWTFRYNQRGGSAIIAVIILCGLVVIPLAAKISWTIAWDVAASFVWNIGLALVVTVAMFTLYPPLPSEPAPAPKSVPLAGEADKRAWSMTLITGLYTIAYFSFDWTNVHTPVYIAIFVQQLSLARGLPVVRAYLAANLAGGLVALILYELIAMAPLFVFMAVLMLAVDLTFGRLMTSGTPKAPLAGAALSVMLLLLGGAMSPFDENASSGFFDRLGEIGAAAIYAVGALYVLEAVLPERRHMPETTDIARG